MSTTKEQVRRETYNKLNKYSTEQLQKKVDSDSLLGLSKEVAIQILKKRGVTVTQESSTEQNEKKPSSTKIKKEPRIQLTETQKNDIKKYHAEGKSTFFIRKTVGVSWSVVNTFIKQI